MTSATVQNTLSGRARGEVAALFASFSCVEHPGNSGQIHFSTATHADTQQERPDATFQDLLWTKRQLTSPLNISDGKCAQWFLLKNGFTGDVLHFPLMLLGQEVGGCVPKVFLPQCQSKRWRMKSDIGP